MDYYLWIIFTLFTSGFCANIQRNNSENNTVVTKGRSWKSSIRELMACGLARDASCFFNVADVIVEERTNDILVQGDQQFMKITGRADEEHSPSQLSKTINRIITEFTELFKDTLSGFFKNAREGQEEDTIEEETKKEPESRSRKVGESRKKKKKEKLIGLIKLIILGIVLKAKITLLLKALSAALQVKFFLVALAGLILNAARFYFDLKKAHKPQKVIYYEHAQHQHHYEGGDDDWGHSGPGGGYWGRSYDEEEESSAQDLAYSKQKPYKYGNSDKSSSSWFG